jgi:hypothetical protein
MTSGYSGTPLAKKLSLKDDMRVWWDEVPDSVRDEIAVEGLLLQRLASPEAPIDAAHIFVTRRGELEAKLHQLMPLLGHGGFIWVSWPKKASKVPDRHHRRRDPRRLPADGAGRREGLRGRRDLVRSQAHAAAQLENVVANGSHYRI